MSEARLVEDERGGITVWVDDQPQSYVDPADPGLLAFEYVAQLGAVLDASAAPGEPLRVTHVGGAGLTLPRYVQYSRPGSPQIVLEPDTVTTQIVRAALPLPRGHRIRVRAVEGRAGVAALRDSSADVVVVDAFAGGRIPAPLASVEFYREVARVLGPAGTAALNVTDEPSRRFLPRVLASLVAAGLGNLCLLATHDVLKSRRFGNYVIAASPSPLPGGAIAREVARSPFPTGMWLDARCHSLARSAAPLRDTDALESPAPPDAGAWRAR